MIVVDSSVWIDFFNGRSTPKTDQLRGFLGAQDILVGDLILCEVLQGFKSDSDALVARDALLSFTIVTMVGREIALRAAENYRSLRGRGITVRKTMDLLIATFCIEGRHQLLHSDRDFEPISQLLGLQLA
jgi:predicted nucleic acid-binding protein